MSVSVEEEDAGSLGSYDLIAALAHDDIEKVYLGAKLALVGSSKLAVLKELRPQIAADATFAFRFLDDAKVASLLNHANILETQEIGEDRGRPFVATEYLEGQTLERVVDRVGPDEFPRATWLRVIADVLAGLHHAHEAVDEHGAPLRMAHLRLSARRVFITYDGQVKILDFGRPGKRTGPYESSSALARASAYVAPEQARTEPVERRTDLFTVGVMLWEASTRKPMWGALSDDAILREIAGGRVPSLREIDPNVPTPLADIVRRALSPGIEDRYATAMHMQTDLEAFLQASGGGVPTSRDVGRVVAQAFLDERLRATTIIDEQLRRLRARAQAGSVERIRLLPLDVANPISGPRSSSDPLRTVGTSPRSFAVAGVPRVLASEPVRQNHRVLVRRRYLASFAALAVLIAAAVAGVLASRQSSASRPASSGSLPAADHGAR